MPACASELSVLLEPVLGDGAVGDDGGAGAGPQGGDAAAQRLQHVAADHDVIGAIAERDIDGDGIGMLQGRGHGVALRRVRCFAGGVAAQPGVQGLDTFIDDLFVRHVARPDRDVGVLIDRLALLDQAPDGGGGIGGLQQRAVGAPLHPLHDDIGIGLEPDRDRLVADTVAGLLAHEGAAAGRQHRRAAVEQPRDHPRLAVPEMRLAMGLEDIRDRHAGRRLDLGIGVEKRQPQPRRQPPSDGGFAGAHHPHQHDRPRPQRGRDLGLGGYGGAGRWSGLGHRIGSIAAGIAAFRATYTTPADTVARETCNGGANMLVVGPHPNG